MKRMPQRLLFGIDHLLDQVDKFSHVRFGLVTNNSSTTGETILSRVALVKAGFRIIKLFSPEHGLSAKGQDGAFQTNVTDSVTGLPVASLYGTRMKPSEEDLSGIDAVLFDIPDVGCRFYTYLWTLTYVMEACAEYSIPLLILDRPNPNSGDLDLVEGPMLDEIRCSSFIGRWSIPIRHSCTFGELACYFASTRVRNLNLKIVKVQNWKRESVTQRSWLFIPPSPAIADEETVLLYPGMGLLEGINVNEGRGSEFPFKIFGAPWVNTAEIISAFQNLQFPGITATPYSYKSSFGPYMDEQCHGLELHVTNTRVFRPVQMGLRLIELISFLYPEYCSERLYKTTANPTGENHLDKLTGVPESLEKIKSGRIINAGTIAPAWKETMQPYLLY